MMVVVVVVISRITGSNPATCASLTGARTGWKPVVRENRLSQACPWQRTRAAGLLHGGHEKIFERRPHLLHAADHQTCGAQVIQHRLDHCRIGRVELKDVALML